jgi:hypothetical protein
MDFHRILERVSDVHHDLTAVESKLRKVESSSTEDFLSDIKRFGLETGLSKLRDLRSARELVRAL